MSHDNSAAIPEDSSTASSPRTHAKTGGIKSLAESGKYTQVVAPLPANLRSEDMLMVPMLTDEQLDKCENMAREPIDFTAEPPSPTAHSNHASDYVDPMDVRRPSNPLAGTNDYVDPSDSVIAQLAKMSGKKKRALSDGDRTPPAVCDVVPPSRDDYTEVSDALPEGKFERIGSQKMYVLESRTQPSSETSPVLSARSAESGKTFQTSPGGKSKKLLLKTQSLYRSGPSNTISTSPAGVLKRRSTSDNKEMVCFSPKSGFKLESRNGSGGNTPEGPLASRKNSSEDAKHSPILSRKEVADDVFLEEGRHVYAAVDLTVKCRPRDDMVRKEGIGAPDHYVACAN